MAFPDFWYDDYQACEGSLSGWSLTNPDGNITFPAGAKKNGSYGMQASCQGDTAGFENAYAVLDIGADKTQVSFGMWVYIPATSDSGPQVDLVEIRSSGGRVCRIRHRKTGGNAYLFFTGATDDSSATFSSDAWYWITVKAVQGNTCSLNIYDAAGSLIDTCSITGGNYVIRNIRVGQQVIFGVTANMLYRFDDLVTDYTEVNFPLLGWETSTGFEDALSGTVTVSGTLSPVFTHNFADLLSGTATVTGGLAVAFTHNFVSTISGAVTVTGALDEVYTRNFADPVSGSVAVSGELAVAPQDVFGDDLSGVVGVTGSLAVAYTHNYSDNVSGTVTISGELRTEGQNDFVETFSGSITISGALAGFEPDAVATVTHAAPMSMTQTIEAAMTLTEVCNG